MEKEEFVCKYCNKKFPSGKSLGGHIRIHSPKKNNKSQKQHQCGVCGESFSSVKALDNHMDCHNYDDEGDEMEIDTHSDTTTTTTTTTTSSGPEIVQGAKGLMFLRLGRKGYNLAVNSFVAESSENNNSEILETKSSSGELLKTPDKAAVDDDDSDDGVSDDDYFMNGLDSDITVGGSLRNTGVGSGFNSFKNGDELRNKEGGSKHELHRSKRVSPSYESDSSADTNSKILRSSEGMAKKASGKNKSSKDHVCPICFKVYSSGQALGGHKRSHTIANQEQRIKHNAADMQLDLNLPAEDSDE